MLCLKHECQRESVIPYFYGSYIIKIGLIKKDKNIFVPYFRDWFILSGSEIHFLT